MAICSCWSREPAGWLADCRLWPLCRGWVGERRHGVIKFAEGEIGQRPIYIYWDIRGDILVLITGCYWGMGGQGEIREFLLNWKVFF